MTPEGSRPDSSIVVPLRRVPIVGASAYSFTIDNGTITLWKRKERADGWDDVASIPAATTRYWGSDGLVYVFPREGADPYHAAADDLGEGKTWRRIGVSVPRQHREATDFAVRQVSKSAGRPVTISPKIDEAVPPLAPVAGPAPDSDPELGRETWKWMAGRLAPQGRLTVGAALAAPWIEKRGGTSALWTLVGEGGAGKTVLLHLCASIYGDPSRWAHTFDTTARGLTSLAQTLSYYPLMLDEAQGITSSPSAALTPIIMGAQRTRSTRSGAVAPDMGRWRSLAFLTSNTALGDDLTHEMWDRRLIEVDAEQLWQTRPTDPVEQAEWWSQIATGVERGRGFAWKALTDQYAPGPAARQWLSESMKHVSMPGAGNIGMVTQLAVAGCRWLAQWTGNPAWAEGVDTVAAAICAEREELKTDPARDAAQDILQHRAIERQAWTSDAKQRVGYADNYKGTCNISHPGDCRWVEIVSKSWPLVCPDIRPQRLKGTKFHRALAPGEGNNLARRIRVKSYPHDPESSLIRAYVVCIPALEQIGYPDPPENAPKLDIAPTPTPPPTEPTPPPPAPAPGDERTGPDFAFTIDPEVGTTLDEAVDDGVTDLVVTPRWTPKKIEEAGWATNDWQGEAGARITRKSDKATIMVRVADSDPEKFCNGLMGFYELTGREIGASPASFAMRLLREAGRAEKKTEPRWQLDAEVRDQFPESRQVAHPSRWGKPGETDQCFDRVRSHLPAITQARLAPLLYGEHYEHLTGDDVPELRRGITGMWRITVPEWDSRLPSPVSSKEPGEDVWVTTELLSLYRQRGVTPQVSEAWVAPEHKIAAMRRWSDQVKVWLSQAAELGDDPTMIVKELYQSFSGRLRAKAAIGKAHSVYRPDWGWAIRDNAWASTVRHAYEIADQHGIYPTAVHTDALYYPLDASVPVYYPKPGEKRKPATLPLGEGLGQFHDPEEE